MTPWQWYDARARHKVLWTRPQIIFVIFYDLYIISKITPYVYDTIHF